MSVTDAGTRPIRATVLDHTAQVGGAELALLRLLPVLDPAEIEARVVVFEDGAFPARLREADVETAVLPLGAAVTEASRTTRPGLATIAQVLAFAVRLARRLRADGTDVVVANSLKSAVVAAIAAPLARRPWVWMLHDRLSRDYLPRPAVLALRVLAVAGPRAIVVNSRATLATVPRGARGKAVVAYPGLTPDAFEPAAPAGGAVVGIVGRVSPTKGQREFLEAAAAVAATHPDSRFRIVGRALFGEDDYEADVRAMPDRLGIADRVVFTGWVDRPGDELRALDVVVHASPVPEPFGQVVVEALAAGVPVVAADAGGVPEILGGRRDGSAWRDTGIGWLHRPGDVPALAAAIRAALDAAGDAEAAAARRARGIRRAERMTIAETAATVAPVWQAAASGSRRHARERS